MSETALLSVLDVLADGRLHSGQRLAEQFGISRTAVAKRIEQLREWGVEITALSGSGYQLAAPLQRLDAALIRQQLAPAAQATAVSVLTSTDSTNTRLAAADAASDPQVLFAERQTAGRGRRGREWISPFGCNLYGSLAWTFAAWPARPTALPLAIAVALARAVAAAGVPEVRIKWPNDLVVEGRKLAGILMETRGEAGGSLRVVIGIGLNVGMSAAQATVVTQPWTSLAAVLGACGRPVPSRDALAAAVISELVAALQHFADFGFTPFAAEWQRRDALAGQAVRIEGSAAFEGFARGVDADGGLIVETPQGARIVHAGDVSVRRAA